jgi:hypothetical protein
VQAPGLPPLDLESEMKRESVSRVKQAGILAAVKPHLDAARGKGFFLHAATYAQALAAAGEDWAVSLSG